MNGFTEQTSGKSHFKHREQHKQRHIYLRTQDMGKPDSSLGDRNNREIVADIQHYIPLVVGQLLPVKAILGLP